MIVTAAAGEGAQTLELFIQEHLAHQFEQAIETATTIFGQCCWVIAIAGSAARCPGGNFTPPLVLFGGTHQLEPQVPDR
jgi:hypothetical protein